MEEYAICYEQLKRICPSNFDTIFIDNTIECKAQITNQRLVSAIGDTTFIFYNRNIGLVNKGLGELDMMVAAEEKFDFDQYSKIVYLTGRKFITCPYVFDRTNNCDSEILVGNQPIINPITGGIYPMGTQMFGDMFFAMSPEKMKKYCKYAKSKLTSINSIQIGSEQILFSFIKENDYSYENIEHLGFVRNDWAMVNPYIYSRRPENLQVV